MSITRPRSRPVRLEREEKSSTDLRTYGGRLADGHENELLNSHFPNHFGRFLSISHHFSEDRKVEDPLDEPLEALAFAQFNSMSVVKLSLE